MIDTHTIVWIVIGVVYISALVVSIVRSWRNTWPMASRVLLLISGLFFVITVGFLIATLWSSGWDGLGYFMLGVGAIILSVIFYVVGMIVGWIIQARTVRTQHSHSLQPRYKEIKVYVHVIVMIMFIWLDLYGTNLSYNMPSFVKVIMFIVAGFGVWVGTSVWQDVHRYPTWYRTIWFFFAVMGCVFVSMLGRMMLGML